MGSCLWAAVCVHHTKLLELKTDLYFIDYTKAAHRRKRGNKYAYMWRMCELQTRHRIYAFYDGHNCDGSCCLYVSNNASMLYLLPGAYVGSCLCTSNASYVAYSGDNRSASAKSLLLTVGTIFYQGHNCVGRCLCASNNASYVMLSTRAFYRRLSGAGSKGQMPNITDLGVSG